MAKSRKQTIQDIASHYSDMSDSERDFILEWKSYRWIERLRCMDAMRKYISDSVFVDGLKGSRAL